MDRIRLFICVLSFVAAATASNAIIGRRNDITACSWDDQEFTEYCC